MLRDLLTVRKDLKVILMSATLNADMFSEYFHGCPHLHIEGFTFPVHTFYLEDVVELIGYTPPTLSKQDSSKRRQQQEQVKEKKLADQLNFTLQQLLTLESAESEPKKPLGALLNPTKSQQSEEAGDDAAALAALANIASLSGGDGSAFAQPSAAAASGAPSNRVTGWTDTWAYKPTVENPWEADQAAGSNDANMLSSLDAIVGGAAAEPLAHAAVHVQSASAAAGPSRTASASPSNGIDRM